MEIDTQLIEMSLIHLLNHETKSVVTGYITSGRIGLKQGLQVKPSTMTLMNTFEMYFQGGKEQ